MNILLSFLLGIVAFIALLLLIGLFMRRKHYVKREITINAPRQRVYDYLRFLKNQENFNKYASAGEREKSFTGEDGTVGYVYKWTGDKKAGAGEKEIISLEPGKRIESEIRFQRPMKTSATILTELESLSANETKVYLSNAGSLGYPLNMFIPKMEKHVAKDMDESLQKLKSIIEAGQG